MFDNFESEPTATISVGRRVMRKGISMEGLELERSDDLLTGADKVIAVSIATAYDVLAIRNLIVQCRDEIKALKQEMATYRGEVTESRAVATSQVKENNKPVVAKPVSSASRQKTKQNLKTEKGEPSKALTSTSKA